jgi:hypothetical protein
MSNEASDQGCDQNEAANFEAMAERHGISGKMALKGYGILPKSGDGKMSKTMGTTTSDTNPCSRFFSTILNSWLLSRTWLPGCQIKVKSYLPGTP